MSGGSKSRATAVVTLDASGNWGCAYTSTGEWFMLQWPLWGRRWLGGSVVCRCNNAAVVAILKSGWCKDELAMHLLRSLFFWLAMFQVLVVAEHITGSCNGPADALSHNNAPSFMSQVPHACRQPSEVPQELVELLLMRRPDWTSQSWTVLLESTLRRV